MKRIIGLAAVALLLSALAGCSCLKGSCGGAPEKAEPTPEETTLVRVGQSAPDFTVNGLDGEPFTLSEHRGKIVLVNWFATWCPPCRQEMPHLQSRIWERFRGEDFVMVSIAREEKADVVAPFVEEFEVTWPFLVDPDRSAYARYAEAFIPRNHVIGRDGTILFQSQGFEEAEFAKMIDVIAAALPAR